MDYYSAGDFGRDRLNQLHAEAREWNLAKRFEAAERARRAHAYQPARPFGGAVRYGLGTLLVCILGTAVLLFAAPLSAGAEDVPEPASMPPQLGALATFADAYIAWDLTAAAGVFAPDAEIFHAFDDGHVARVRGSIHRADWLRARAFLHTERWSLTRHTDTPRSGLTLHLTSARYDDIAAELVWYVAPLLLDADVAPDGAIARLYAAYSPEGLSSAIEAAATGVLPGLPRVATITAVPSTPPQSLDASEAALSALTTVRVGPERGDYSWIALAAGLMGAALVAQRLHAPRHPRRAARSVPSAA